MTPVYSWYEDGTVRTSLIMVNGKKKFCSLVISVTIAFFQYGTNHSKGSSKNCRAGITIKFPWQYDANSSGIELLTLDGN